MYQVRGNTFSLFRMILKLSFNGGSNILMEVVFVLLIFEYQKLSIY